MNPSRTADDYNDPGERNRKRTATSSPESPAPTLVVSASSQPQPSGESLEKRLEERLDARIGDFILVEMPKISVAGFVQKRDDDSVTLSYRDPNSMWKKYSGWDGGDRYDYAGMRNKDRTYNLRKFQHSTVLRPSGLIRPLDPGWGFVSDTARNRPFLDTVMIGHPILLESRHLTVGGYVIERSPESVTLSHVDPNSRINGPYVHDCGYSYDGWFGAGDKVFYYKTFQRYLILSSHTGRQK